MQECLPVFSNIKFHIYPSKLTCSKPSFPCLKIPENLIHLQHLAFHVTECIYMLSTLKNRVVLRPKGEPVIGPPSWTTWIQSTNSNSTSIMCSLIFSSQLFQGLFAVHSFQGLADQDFVDISCFKSCMFRTQTKCAQWHERHGHCGSSSKVSQGWGKAVNHHSDTSLRTPERITVNTELIKGNTQPTCCRIIFLIHTQLCHR